MCLDTIWRTTHLPKSVVAWKVFKATQERGYFDGEYHGQNYRAGQTRVDKQKYVHEVYVYGGRGGGKYKTGFHAFLQKKEAQSYCGLSEQVRRVRLSDLTAIGRQLKRQVVVGRTMYIYKIGN